MVNDSSGDPDSHRTGSGRSDTPRARVRIFDEDGNLQQDLTGDDRVGGQPEEFLRSLTDPVDEPHEFIGSGWQQVDEDHPIGSGQPAYRIAYKTLRIIPFPGIELTWPNLRVLIRNGRVSRGGMTATEGVPGRGLRRNVVPEYGKIYNATDNQATYIRGLNSAALSVGGWEENLDAVSFVEITYRIDDVAEQDYEALLRRGRRAIAPLKTLLDLQFGPRLLAMPLLEEVGESFADWHWNRRVHTGSLLVESQATLRQLHAREITQDLTPLIDHQQAMSLDEGRRVTLACLWYWRADADSEPSTKLISWWLVAESLEMTDTNIVHIRRRLATIFGTDEEPWRLLVGRLATTRSRVVHGEEGEVDARDLERAEILARVLLSSRLLLSVPESLRNALTQAAEEQNRN